MGSLPGCDVDAAQKSREHRLIEHRPLDEAAAAVAAAEDGPAWAREAVLELAITQQRHQILQRDSKKVCEALQLRERQVPGD